MNKDASLLTRSPSATLALAMVISGTIGAFVVEAGLHPVTTVFWRCCFGSIFLGVLCLLRGYLSWDALNAGQLARAAAGGVCIVLNWVALFAALKMTSIATATIAYHVQPFFVVLLGIFFFKERITRDQVLWMLAAFAGVVLASGMVLAPTAAGSTWAWGIALTLGAAALYGVSTMIAKSLGGQRPEVTALCQTTVGMAMLVAFADYSVYVSPASWAWLVGIGVIHTGISYVLMYSAYPRLTTPIIGILTFIYPMVAIFVDWVFYAHPLGWAQAVGMLLIALGTLGVKLGWRLGFRPAL